MSIHFKLLVATFVWGLNPYFRKNFVNPRSAFYYHVWTFLLCLCVAFCDSAAKTEGAISGKGISRHFFIIGFNRNIFA